MSEKQFKIINELGDYHLLDGDEELCYDLCSSAMAKENWDNVVEKLNELNTEREYLIGERGKLETKNVLLRKENEQLRVCLNRMQKLFPDVELPDVYTQIGDFEQSIVVCGHRVGISLEKYLGADYPVYKRFFDEQQRKQMTREYMIPECVGIYLLSQFPFGDFQQSSQESRDFHLQCIWYAVNKLLGEDFYEHSVVAKVDDFMQSHKNMSLPELLDYSRREMSKASVASMKNAK